MYILKPEEREFIGWFWGEGCLMIQRVTSKNSKKGNFYYRPVMVIAQRDDDADILKWCQKRFGGQLERRAKTNNTNPRASWRLIGFKGCQEVVKVLSQGVLPSKKKRELVIFKEFLSSKLGSGKVMSSEIDQKFNLLRNQLRFLKIYNPSLSS